ncbi:MAG: hypothetical protein HKN79_10370 [Flavobacteriales bacterium]|nr:hypothetical protein [Flavobacteriales bacterium]
MGLRFLVLIGLSTSLTLSAQTEYVKVKGKVVDATDGVGLSTMMAVDKNSGSGTFGNGDGEFVMNLEKGDTLLVGAIGYETISFAIPADYEGTVLSKTFYMEKLVVTLPPVDVIPERELEEIKEDIEELGYNREDYQLSGINALQSPITFLYQSFSRRERSKRLVAELRNQDRMRELLKELFQKYVDYDIIQLEDDEFDDFIDFCNVSEYFLKNSSQYDFLVHVKRRFSEYKDSPVWIRHRAVDDEDYYRE